MKKTVRWHCHETNSSSQHAICVTKRKGHVTREDLTSDDWDNPEKLYIWKDELRENVEDDFGRSPFEVLYTFEDKLRYAICAYMGRLYPDDPEFEEYEKMFKKIVRDLTGAELMLGHPMDFPIYLDEDGNELRRRSLEYDHYDPETEEAVYTYKDENGEKHLAKLDEEYVNEAPKIGMIDHQSDGLLQNFLKETGISLEEFLTNKKYIIVIDGDEYQSWERYKTAGIINTDNIEAEYYGYGADPEWLEWLKENGNEKSEETTGI